MSGGTGYIKGFDGLRAISVLLVLGTHAGLYRMLPGGAFFTGRIWPMITGQAGVGVFFVLSGYLITTLLLKERQRSGTISLRRFYARRFLRLTPQFVVFILFTWALAEAGIIKARPLGLVVSFLYLYDFMPKTHLDAGLSHTWSLAVEEQFYLIWPLLAMSFSRSRLLVTSALVIVVCGVAYLVFPDLVIPFSSHQTRLAQLFHVPHLFVPAVGAIMVGALAGILRAHGTVPGERLLRWMPLLFALLYGASLWMPGPLLRFTPLFQAVGVALLLVWIVERQRTLLVRVLEFRPLAYLGKISYGIYLYHVIFMSTGPGHGLVPRFPYGLLASLAFAVVSYEFLERRVLRYKDRFR